MAPLGYEGAPEAYPVLLVPQSAEGAPKGCGARVPRSLAACLNHP